MQGVRHAGPRIVSYYYNSISGVERLQAAHSGRHLEILPVTPSLLSGQALSAAKGLARLPQRSFAALRMTGRPPLKPAQTVFAEMGYDEATTNHIAAQAATRRAHSINSSPTKKRLRKPLLLGTQRSSNVCMALFFQSRPHLFPQAEEAERRLLVRELKTVLHRYLEPLLG